MSNLFLRHRAPLAAGVGLATVVALWNLPAGAQSGDDSAVGLSVFAAIVLGLVEGLTEYLPVSSTGHLLVTTELLGLGGTEETDRALDAYAICIQAGAIIAVLVLYQQRIRQLIDGLLGRSEDGRRILLAVIAAFVPTAIIGLTLGGIVRDNLFGVIPIAIAWLVGGIGILALTRSGVLQRSGQELYEITWRQAGIIGVCQAIALWPGVSRSLITIVTAVLVGLTLRAAVEFSFLLGLVTLSAATVLTTYTDGSLLFDEFGVVTPIIGLIVAFVAAVGSVRWMVSWLEQRSFDVFGYYRIVIGVVALVAVAMGWLST
ncbi:MAG: undecaprenyl-diphosphate phosphatase [Actinomycetota bacterium]